MSQRRIPVILVALLFVGLPTATAVSDSLSDAAADAVSPFSCLPEVRIHIFHPPYTICLNTMNPGDDSCAEVTIDGGRLFGAYLHFANSDTGTWRYIGMESTDTASLHTKIRIELTNGPDGNLAFMDIYSLMGGDSLLFLPELRIDNDRPAAPDTIPKVNISVSRTAYDCHPKKTKMVFDHRIYTYPPGFRRDPVINQAERSMFHSGMSVRMPTAYSLENRAVTYVYWHCQVLTKLEFENPEEIVKTEAALNKFRRKNTPVPVKKKSRITLSALR